MTLNDRSSRWGADDERGAANLVTSEKTREAVSCVQHGKVIQLGSEVGKRGAASGGRNPTWHLTLTVQHPNDPGRGRAEDTLNLHTHSHSHMDGLAHLWFDGKLYNNFPPSSVGRGGASRLGIDKVGPIVTRGLLLDLTQGGTRQLGVGEVLEAEDLEAAARAADLTPRPGDALLIRTGWFDHFLSGNDLFQQGEPGLGASAIEWIVNADPSVVGMDNGALEPLPPAPGVNPLLVHEELLARRGIFLLELLDLAELSREASGPFCFTVAPLKIEKGLGSPVNPVAVL